MIASAQWQFGFFIKRSHCPLWLIEKVWEVTPHSGGRGCFIYTFFPLLFSVCPPLPNPLPLPPYSTPKMHHKAVHVCHGSARPCELAVHECLWAFISSMARRKSLQQSHLCLIIPRHTQSLSLAETLILRVSWGLTRKGKGRQHQTQQHVLPSPTAQTTEREREKRDKLIFIF